MTTYDVIVIGAGVAGLAAARRLHDAGRTVLVCEGVTASVVGSGATRVTRIGLSNWVPNSFMAMRCRRGNLCANSVSPPRLLGAGMGDGFGITIRCTMR